MPQVRADTVGCGICNFGCLDQNANGGHSAACQSYLATWVISTHAKFDAVDDYVQTVIREQHFAAPKADEKVQLATAL